MSTLEKQLIVNGRLNPSLALSEILENFESSDIARAAWSIVVDLKVHHKMEDVPTYDEVHDDPENHLKALWERRAEKLAKDDEDEKAQHKQEGEALYRALSAVRTPRSHVLCLYPYQAVSYIGCLSAWNNFLPYSVCKAVIQIEELNIRSDFGINNPNTGKKIVSWEVVGDCYFTLRLDTMGSDTKTMIKRDYDHLIKTIMAGTNAYVEVTEGQYEMRYTMIFD